MIPLRVEQLAAVLDARTVGPVATTVIERVMTDSRVASDAPAAFFALRTAHADGHAHVAAAADAGAAVAIVDHAVDGASVPQLVVDDPWRAIARLARHVVDTVAPTVVAITGSYGKTTVKDLTAAALAPARRVVASRGSFNNELGVPLTMLDVADGVDVLVAEAGARNAGDLTDLGRLLAPDVAVVTAVGPVHLETFGDEDGVAAEKSRLVAALGPAGTAVLNADDPRVTAMARLAPATLTVSAAGAAADVRARDVRIDAAGRVRALADTPWGSVDVALPLPGTHHLTNGLLALAVAGHVGVPLEDAAAALAEAPTSPHRAVLQRVGGVTVLDDAYNASPPTVRGALRTLADLPCDGRRWAVLGEMAELGPDADAQHRAVGDACGALDVLVVVGAAAGPLADAAAALPEAPEVHRVADHVEAAALVRAMVRPGDAVLFKASRVATLDRAVEAVLAALDGEAKGSAA